MAQVDVTVVDNSVELSSPGVGLSPYIVVPSNGVELTGWATRTPYVYVTDYGNHRVNVYDYDGVYQFSFGSYGTGDGEFNGPYGIAQANERVFVTDSMNDRVQCFDLFGNWLFSFGATGTGDGQLDRPLGIVADGRAVYVVDHFNHRVAIFHTNGDFWFNIGTFGSGDYEFNHPTDAWDDADYVYIDDTGNSRVVILAKAPIIWEDYLSGTVPIVSVSLEGACRSAYIDAEVPTLETSFTTRVGYHADIEVNLPFITSDFNTGTEIGLELPSITHEFVATQDNLGSISVTLNAPELEASAESYGLGSISVDVGFLSTDFNAWINNNASIIVTVPVVSMLSAQSAQTNMGTVDATVPIPSLSSTQWLNNVGSMDVDISDWFFVLLGSQRPGAARYAISVNTVNGGNTDYTNFSFNSMTYFNGKYLGCLSGGIYEIGASDDAGTAIVSDIRTRQVDMFEGTNDQTVAGTVYRLEGAIITYNTATPMKHYLLTEDGLTYTTSLSNKKGYISEERIKYGKGLKQRYYTFQFKNGSAGDDFIIDSFIVRVNPIYERIR